MEKARRAFSPIMTVEGAMASNVDLVRRWFREVWCEPRNPETIDELMPEDSKLYGLNPVGPLTREDFKKFRRHFLAMYPDVRVEVTHVMAAGDMVAFHAQVSGVHSDSKRPVNFTGTAIVQFRDGKMIESHETWDFATMLTQNGVLSEDVAARELIGE